MRMVLRATSATDESDEPSAPSPPSMSISPGTNPSRPLDPTTARAKPILTDVFPLAVTTPLTVTVRSLDVPTQRPPSLLESSDRSSILRSMPAPWPSPGPPRKMRLRAVIWPTSALDNWKPDSPDAPPITPTDAPSGWT